MTRDERREWLRERQTGIGGSDAAAALDLSPYKSRRELWREKTGAVREDEPTPPMLRGQHLEHVAADLYEEETGRRIRREPMRRHPEHDFMLGNPDRLILATDGVDSTGVLEIKCPGIRTFGRIKARGMPDHYTLQLMHYLAVTGHQWGSFALFNAERWQMLHFDLERDEDLIERLIAGEREFWSYVERGEEPPEEDGEDGPDISSPDGEVTVVGGSEWEEATEELMEARELKSTAKDLESRAKKRLKGMMEDAGTDAVEVPGRARIYWREQEGRTSWKKTAKKMAADNDLDLDDYRVVGSSYRRFRPHSLNGEG